MLILVGTAFFAFFIYPGLSFAMTADIDDLSTIKDKFTIRMEKIQKEEVPFTYDGDNLSEDYCDCNNLDKCLLSNKKVTGNNYLNVLKDRKSVPTVSDLSLSDVCKNLYGDFG